MTLNEQMDLADIFITFHPKTEYTFLSIARRTFSRIDHVSPENKPQQIQDQRHTMRLF